MTGTAKLAEVLTSIPQVALPSEVIEQVLDDWGCARLPVAW